MYSWCDVCSTFNLKCFNFRCCPEGSFPHNVNTQQHLLHLQHLPGAGLSNTSRVQEKKKTSSMHNQPWLHSSGLVLLLSTRPPPLLSTTTHWPTVRLTLAADHRSEEDLRESLCWHGSVWLCAQTGPAVRIEKPLVLLSGARRVFLDTATPSAFSSTGFFFFVLFCFVVSVKFWLKQYQWRYDFRSIWYSVTQTDIIQHFPDVLSRTCFPMTL